MTETTETTETCKVTRRSGHVCGKPATEVIVPGVYAVCYGHAQQLGRARKLADSFTPKTD